MPASLSRNVRRVLLVTPTLVEADGGVPAHVRATARAMAHAGHEVTIAAGRVGDGNPGSYAVVPMPGLDFEAPTPSSIAALDDLCARGSFDVVHLHEIAPGRAVQALRRYAPVVASVHGYSCCTPGTYFFEPGNECSRPHGPGCIPNMLLRGCAHSRQPAALPGRYRETGRRRAGLAAADGIIAYSSAVERHLANNNLQRVYRVRLFTESAVDVSAIPTDARLLFVGRIVRVKGLTIAIRAMAESGTNAILDVYGDGWALPEARHLVERLGLREQVRFHGWAGDEELRAAYRACTAVVVPSVWPEPFGLVGLEAMAHGRPVIAAATGGIPDWLMHDETGLLVQPGSPARLAIAIAKLLADRDMAAQFGRAGARLVAERFTASGHVRDLEIAYSEADLWWRSTK